MVERKYCNKPIPLPKLKPFVALPSFNPFGLIDKDFNFDSKKNKENNPNDDWLDKW